MAVSQSGTPIYADTAGLSRLARNLRAVAPVVWAETRLELKAIGELVAKDARANASFSTKVPGSIRVLTGKGNVRVRAGGPSAPNAAALESRGKGHPRHPLFGNRSYWYTNDTPAFLNPALDKNRDKAATMIYETISRAVQRAIDEAST